ncbi:MAG: hypothetical protein WEB06_18310 [Actinomycetota bacterium]
MLPPEIVAAGQAIYPDAGTLRVHPAPERLHPPEPDRPGRNRFDDPDGAVAVRYTATRLSGCLRETMSRFRPSPSAEAALDAVAGVEDADIEWDRGDPSGLRDWLAVQRVGTVRVKNAGFFIDIETPAVLTQLDKHPRVRSAVAALDAAAHLDVGLLRLGGIGLGRPISQAVGVALREWIPDALGAGYRSRFAPDEPCWAIWHTTAVGVESVPLTPADPHHGEAVRSVAAEFEIVLPAGW